MNDFDRIRPPGDPRRRAEAGTEARDAAGRAALFSASPGTPGARRRDAAGAFGLVLHCSRCGAATPLDTRAVVRAALPLFLVAPWRRHPVFAACPACRRRAWLRVASGPWAHR